MTRWVLTAGLGLSLTCLLTACQPTSQSTLAASATAADAWVQDWRKTEPAAITAQPKVAARAGSTLTISLDGKPVARFSDVDLASCEGFDTCSGWQFAGTRQLQQAPGKTATFARLGNTGGESTSTVFVGADGRLFWFFDDEKISPDGRYIAGGHMANIISSGGLEIRDFASPDHALRARFAAKCDIVGWTSVTSVDVKCNRDDDGPFEAAGTITEIAPGKWQLVETKVLTPGDGPAIALQSETARMEQEKLSAEDRAGSDNYERSKGYKRLVP